MRGSYWYYTFYWRNWLAGQKRRYDTYGIMAFMPHRHWPYYIPAGDGWYCYICGSRSATVQKRGRSGHGQQHYHKQ
jgi:hypothetical protein